MSTKTVMDVAYDVIKKKKNGIAFADLWKNVRQTMGYDDAQAARKISQFYTDLTLDGRFAALKNNKWYLKDYRKFSEVYVDTSSLVDDDSDEEDIDLSDVGDTDDNAPEDTSKEDY
jgi:DNA-directed RNA polymerase subunit delta